MNMWAVAMILYRVSIIHCTKEEIVGLHSKKRTMMCMHGALHRIGNVVRLYITMENEGRLFIRAQDYFVSEQKILAHNDEDYLRYAA